MNTTISRLGGCVYPALLNPAIFSEGCFVELTLRDQRAARGRKGTGAGARVDIPGEDQEGKSQASDRRGNADVATTARDGP